MIKSPLTTPILFLLYRRLDTTQRVFNKIRKAKPKKLFIAADGPRKGSVGEAEKCQAVRNIVKQVDWHCEVHTLFRKDNLGLKLAISSAIDWFFKNVEAGIILEDDCLPNQSFFWFCQELLKKYQEDERIMMIAGSCPPLDNINKAESYYFSRLAGIWGWATWRRAWKYFDIKLKDFPIFKRQEQIKNIFYDKNTRSFWLAKISQVYQGGQSWAFAWAYSILVQNGLCICPTRNLISNIGWGPGAINSKYSGSVFEVIKTENIKKIIHPSFIVPNMEVDRLGTIMAAKEQMPTLFIKGKIRHKIIPAIINIFPKTWRKSIVKIWKSKTLFI